MLLALAGEEPSCRFSVSLEGLKAVAEESPANLTLGDQDGPAHPSFGFGVLLDGVHGSSEDGQHFLENSFGT